MYTLLNGERIMWSEQQHNKDTATVLRAQAGKVGAYNMNRGKTKIPFKHTGM